MISRQERVNFLIISACQEMITVWTDGKNEFTEEEKKYLRMARTLIRKTCISKLSRMMDEDPEGAERLMKDAKSHNLAIEPKRSLAVNTASVPYEQLKTLTDIVVEDCQTRDDDWCMQNWKDCSLRKALQGCEVQYKNKSKGCRTCRYKNRREVK